MARWQGSTNTFVCCLEGQHVIPASGRPICLLRTSTSGIAVVERTSSRVDSPPRFVGDRNSPSNNDCADVIDSRTEGVSVNDLGTACSRVGWESTEVLMHILSIGESALQGESNRLCSHKARGRIDNDCFGKLVSTVDFASMGRFEVVCNRREVLERQHVEMMWMGVSICRRESEVDRIRMERVACRGTAGLELLPFIDKDISSKGNFSGPVPSILVSAFEGGHEILQSSQASSQIIGSSKGKRFRYVSLVK